MTKHTQDLKIDPSMSPQDKLSTLKEAEEALAPHAGCCRLCPRCCAVNRSAGETGFCGLGTSLRVSHTLLHFGEEPILSGVSDCRSELKAKRKPAPGSGAVFFSGCNLHCLYCQNYQISWLKEGKTLSGSGLADKMLELQALGAANLNLVSPSPQLLPILKALRLAVGRGLSLPIVYNSHGYENPAVLKRLDGIVDIYLPDLKYFSPRLSGSLSHAPDYFRTAREALLEMYCQQPGLEIDAETGLARRGMIVRHLVLPGHSDDSCRVLDWLAGHLSPYLGLSLMSQYSPCFQAPPDLRRRLFPEEYQRVRDFALSLGFVHLFLQPEPYSREESLLPDFERTEPFSWR